LGSCCTSPIWFVGPTTSVAGGAALSYNQFAGADSRFREICPELVYDRR